MIVFECIVRTQNVFVWALVMGDRERREDAASVWYTCTIGCEFIGSSAYQHVTVCIVWYE